MIIAIVGPSGSGKTTLSYLMCKYGAVEVVSTTTRPPRNGERDGIDYHFVSKEEFHKKIEAGEFVEHAQFGDNLYGATKEAFSAALESSQNNCAVLVCEIAGYRSLKQAAPKMGQYLSGVFISWNQEVLEQRLKKRLDDGLISQAQFQERISFLPEELKNEFEMNSDKSNIVIKNPSMDELEDYAMIFANSSSSMVTPTRSPEVKEAPGL